MHAFTKEGKINELVLQSSLKAPCCLPAVAALVVKGKNNNAMPTGEVFVVFMTFNFNQACYIRITNKYFDSPLVQPCLFKVFLLVSLPCLQMNKFVFPFRSLKFC